MWQEDVDFQAWLASQSIGAEVDRDLLYKAWCAGSSHTPKWSFLDNALPFSNSAGIVEGGLFEGYLNPHKYLESAQARRLQGAVETIRSFESAMYRANLWDEM